MKKLLCLCMIAVCLFGCSSEEEKLPVMVCEMNGPSQVGDITMTNNFTYEGEKVLEQQQVTKIVAQDEDSYATVLSLVEQAKAMYDGMEGAKYEVKEDKDNLTVTETITLVYEDMDKQDLINVAGVTTSDGNDTFSYIDVDKTKSNLESSGWTCTKE